MNILFWLNTSKKNKQGKHPLYCRITISGERAEISTGIHIKKQEFDIKKKRIKNTNQLAEDYNKLITQLTYKLSRIYYEQVFNGNNPTVYEVKEQHINKQKKRTTKLKDVIAEHVNAKHNRYKNLITLKRNERFFELIKMFLKRTKKENIDIANCNYDFYDEFAQCLRLDKHFSAGYIKKIIELLKSSIRFAYEKGYTTKLPVDYTILFKDSKEIIYLTQVEIEKISKHEFLEPHLQRIADCFMVQCYTGLSYVDLSRLDANNVVIEKDGLWININRQKVVSATSTIPILKNVKELLIKYNFKLPVISNQKYNSGLKEIAREVGIHKNLTSHVGRKTFGTLLLNKDVPIETVSSLLGHSTVSMTQKHYAKVLHMKIAKDLRLIM